MLFMVEFNLISMVGSYLTYFNCAVGIDALYHKSVPSVSTHWQLCELHLWKSLFFPFLPRASSWGNFNFVFLFDRNEVPKLVTNLKRRDRNQFEDDTTILTMQSSTIQSNSSPSPSTDESSSGRRHTRHGRTVRVVSGRGFRYVLPFPTRLQ